MLPCGGESRPLHITSGDATSLKQTCRNPDQRWCRQIVPDSNAQLCERHIAAFVAMATVRGYPQLVWSQVSPVMLPVNTEQCAGFSLSSDKATGDQAPQHCASPGCPGLPLILLCSPVSAGLKNKNPNLAIGIPVTMYALQDIWGWRQTPGLKNARLHPTYENQ